MGIATPMHNHVHDGGKERQNGEELAEAQFKRGELQPRTNEEVSAIEQSKQYFTENEHPVRELEFHDSKNTKTDEEHEENHEVDLHGEHGNAEITAEVFQEERADGGDEDAEERL